MSVGYMNQRRATEAALNNEQVTRERVVRLERQLGLLQGDLNQHALWISGFLNLGHRGFWGRLRWLFTGR